MTKKADEVSQNPGKVFAGFSLIMNDSERSRSIGLDYRAGQIGNDQF
jgi:hypothetical protein